MIQDALPAHGVLAARYSQQQVASAATTRTAVLYLGIVLVGGLSLVVGLLGAAPRLVGRWPQVFMPVIDSRERIGLTGVCLAGAALTLAITWMLTGPGG